MARLLSISRPGGIQLFFLEKANLGQMKSRNSLMPTRKLLMISTNSSLLHGITMLHQQLLLPRKPRKRESRLLRTSIWNG